MKLFSDLTFEDYELFKEYSYEDFMRTLFDFEHVFSRIEEVYLVIVATISLPFTYLTWIILRYKVWNFRRKHPEEFI